MVPVDPADHILEVRAPAVAVDHLDAGQTIQNLVTINIDKKYVELVRYTQFRAQT